MTKDIEYILKDFVRHVMDLKAEDDPAGSGFHREFRILRELQIQNKNEDKFECEDGKLEENIKKNRYKDIIPRDDRRVKLTEIPGQKGSDYINATFIEDVEGIYGYIAAQGPMPHTANDFWRMLWEYNSEIIFMACRTKEENRPKCEKYWADVGKSSTFGEITIYTESEEEIQDHFIKRHLRAVRDNEVHHLTQFQYTGWPDHNTPSSPDALRCMIEDVRKFRKRLDIPMVVHCSAGCGRTGTIIAIDLAWTMLDKGMIKEEFSMFDIIKSLREQRTSMVQTPDQYEYTHMVMKSLCNEWLADFTKHDYENVVVDQPVNEAAPVNEQESYYNVAFPRNSGDLNSPFQSDGDSLKDAPILPKRSYKPEEIADDSQKPLQNQTSDNNILRQHPGAQTTFPDGQAPQPPTKTHPVLQSVPSGGVQVVALRPAVQPQLIDHRTLDHQPQPGLGRLAALQPGQDLPGTVRAIGGLPIERQIGGSIKAAKPINTALPTGKDKPLMIATSQVNQAVILTTPAHKPASGKMMAGMEKLRDRIPFHFGQQKGYPPSVSQAPKHRASALPARPRRPAGPRPPPATWSARSQTYL